MKGFLALTLDKGTQIRLITAEGEVIIRRSQKIDSNKKIAFHAPESIRIVREKIKEEQPAA